MKHSDFSRFCEIAGSLGVLTVRISQDGELIFRHNWDDDCRRNLYSATKSFTSAAMGALRSSARRTDRREGWMRVCQTIPTVL